MFEETPARELSALGSEKAERIAALRRRYQVQFEHQLNAATSLLNYEYLDLLDRGWRRSGLERPQGGVLCDIGCASFWYAATLQSFFRPMRLVGVEVEGYRLFKGGYTRRDYAAGYLARMPNAQFVVADYSRREEPADVITAWFPFLTATALLAWRLPLSLLAPEQLFRQIKHNLQPQGLFFMVNHGATEAALASDCCVAAGLELAARWTASKTLGAPRMQAPHLSWWKHARERNIRIYQ